MADFFVEILCEEIPARFQALAVRELEAAWARFFKEKNLTTTKVKAFVTPRRLAFIAEGLPTAQPDVTIERRGPRTDAPEPAIQGFLKSTGLTVEQCESREIPKGTFLFATLTQKGRATADVLSEGLFEIVGSLPWPKSMRWGNLTKSWVRPIHSVIALFEGRVLEKAAEHSPYDVPVGITTRGHRFMGNGEFSVSSFADYETKLKEEGVILDAAKRREIIVEQANQSVQEAGVTWIQDENLLDEVTGLVEWPVVLLGRIDPEFMCLPEEVTTTYMQAHQRYFACRDSEGCLAPYFLVVANTKATDEGKQIVEGNERVLRARLSDAQFCEAQDRKTPLATYAERLSELVFHEKLGTLAEKAERLESLAVSMATQCEVDVSKARQVAKLCKADLMTQMVAEFPKLQGTMGRYYAKDQGEEIAQAIEDHYAPRGAFEPLPEGKLGRLVGLADRIDTLVGFFAVGIRPTGSKDPYALRRAALATIRLIESGLDFTLTELISWSYGGYKSLPKEASSLEKVTKDLLAFFEDRLKVYWRDSGLPHDIITAVFGRAASESLLTLRHRAQALSNFLNNEDGQHMLVAYRRARNIVRIEEERDKTAYRDSFDESLFQSNEEKTLASALKKAQSHVKVSLESSAFEEAMGHLARLRGPVDDFFEHVTVNADAPSVRGNRLKLLSCIRGTLETVADFSHIEGGV
ncbi:MAG: glycine--tRNA ligase subunit beta [bacterium]|nr:glycine--tRNA ligase subunit beta [bacterium]